MTRVIAYELDILGNHGMAATDYPLMLAMVESGVLRPDLLAERTVGGITIIDPQCFTRATEVSLKITQYGRELQIEIPWCAVVSDCQRARSECPPRQFSLRP